MLPSTSQCSKCIQDRCTQEHRLCAASPWSQGPFSRWEDVSVLHSSPSCWPLRLRSIQVPPEDRTCLSNWWHSRYGVLVLGTVPLGPWFSDCFTLTCLAGFTHQNRWIMETGASMYSDLSTQVFHSVEHSHLCPCGQVNNLNLIFFWEMARDKSSGRVLDLPPHISIPTDISMVTGRGESSLQGMGGQWSVCCPGILCLWENQRQRHLVETAAVRTT